MTAYEKGAANNLVKFSNYPDLAFEDTGINIDDDAPPNKNVLWSSDKISEQIKLAVEEYTMKYQQPMVSTPSPEYNNVVLPTKVNKFKTGAKIQGPYGGYIDVGLPKFNLRPSRIPRVFRPSYYMSYMIPSRQHYCNKCNNYMEHRYASKWKNQIRPGSSCEKKCNCNSV